MNVGIIGAGNIANKMAKTINALEGFTNYAIGSRNLEKAKKFKSKYGFIKAYGSYEELIKDENVELVYIATPHSCHYEEMLMCLKYHKPVLCEKIFTTSLKDTRDIYEKFEKENLFVQEALWTSFMPSRYRINELLFKENIIGPLQEMFAYFKAPIMMKKRVQLPELGGGVAMDIGVYPISFVLRTFGFDYDRIVMKKLKHKKGVDSKEVFNIEYSSGLRGTCYVDGGMKVNLSVAIYGDNGTMFIDSVNCPRQIKIYDKYSKIIDTYDFKIEHGGFEYQLIAAKKAIEEGKLECEEWTHRNSIALSKAVEEVLSHEEDIK